MDAKMLIQSSRCAYMRMKIVGGSFLGTLFKITREAVEGGIGGRTVVRTHSKESW